MAGAMDVVWETWGKGGGDYGLKKFEGSHDLEQI